jgi:chromosome segregation ATPase
MVAAPAYAQTDPTPPARLTELKARADEAVKDRLGQLDKLNGAINGAGADCGQNADVAGQLANDRTGLQQLDATIQAETDGKKAVAEYRQIFTDFRIYWLQTPKTRQVVACDRESKADATLTSLKAKIQARVDEAKAKGYDVSGAQAALDDMGTKLTDATTKANQASSSVADLQPDKGDQAVLSSNFAALGKGRQDLHAGWTDLQGARHDARTAIDDLKNLHKG